MKIYTMSFILDGNKIIYEIDGMGKLPDIPLHLCFNYINSKDAIIIRIQDSDGMQLNFNWNMVRFDKTQFLKQIEEYFPELVQ